MEKYYWVIEYPDGRQIKELLDDGNLSAEAFKQEPPFVFHLVPTSNNLQPLDILIDKSKRLIFFRRRLRQMKIGSTGERSDILVNTFYASGWQETINGRNVKSIIWLDSNTGKIYNSEELNIKVEENG